MALYWEIVGMGESVKHLQKGNRVGVGAQVRFLLLS